MGVGKPRGIRAARKLLDRRRNQRLKNINRLYK